MSRWKASAIHLSLSALVALGVLLLVLTLWYPGTLFRAAGANELVTILVGVDVVIGPLITLIIFNTKKKHLRFDLSCVALLQLAALGYGCYTVFQARPVAIVFVGDRFDLVTASDIVPEELAKVTRDEYRNLPLTGPWLVAYQRPVDAAERNRLLFAGMAGVDAGSFPRYYVPYGERAQAAAAIAKPLTELARLNAGREADIQGYAREHARPAEQVGFLPLKARRRDVTVLLDKRDGQVIEIVPLIPW
jgi:hypothetical protein